MDPQTLRAYLHRQIPLSAAMQVDVRSVTAQSVVLSAPLDPNINHKSTVFGGSASTLAILAAWSLVHLRLVEAGLASEVVIQSSQMDYGKPMQGAFSATSMLADEAAWPLFVKTLGRKGRARIAAGSVLTCDGIEAGRFMGRFVAFLHEPG